ncbi:MAG: TonB-dependent receptor [Muribaculaceae bacterium]|nr:TonB-dependent receptor [Muribaculaceae bacterium]
MKIRSLHLRLLAAAAVTVTSAAALYASPSPATPQDDIVELEEFTIIARRPMQEIGVQKTTFDSIALKENISLSMADVLTFNSSVFVKSAGRATLSTVAFRGTSASHTNVSWNGMRINSPMLGMTDFSTIPSFFIDKASLLHGTSSVNEAGGGLGGAVSLATAPEFDKGLGLNYVQGIGSFKTFDEFLKASYSNRHWAFTTRAVYSSSANDYTYINRDKKLNIYDDDHNIIGQYHPKEKNRSGSFKDLHILQEAYYDTRKGDRFLLNLWYTSSNREIPMLSTDYGEERGIDNRQRENTLRSVAGWRRGRSTWNLDLRAGYIHTWLGYDYRREMTQDVWSTLTHSRSLVNTFFGNATANFFPSDRWLFTASLTANHHNVKSTDRQLSSGSGTPTDIGYHKRRLELSGALTARWQPVDGVGVSATVREETYGNHATAPIPALFADWKAVNAYSGKTLFGLTLKASGSRNYRYPSLNDLYFMPGGNPDLRDERGWTYDCGFDFEASQNRLFSAGFSATWFDSRIDDWIIWLPTIKGFFSPRNVKSVHAYGIELKGDASLTPWSDWKFDLNASYSWTPSVNVGEKMSDADKSIGKQLPYIPRHSASASLRAFWKTWGITYKCMYYSERFTMTSNASTLTGDLPAYSISNISLEKTLQFPLQNSTTQQPNNLTTQLKLTVNNLFNTEYLSVLSRPMPGTNLELFISIAW